MDLDRTRFAQVSRRALLKGSLGAGALAALSSCGNNDVEVFAGEATDPATTTTQPPASTTTVPSNTVPSNTVPPTTAPADETRSTPSTTTSGEPPVGGVAVNGEMVIGFTYTRAAGGKLESPYVAVWIEDAAGDLAQTISLWYQQRRRGERWLDHLHRWYDLDAQRVAAGGPVNASTISSATREPGSYAVVWDGTIDGSPAAAGDYFICIEAVREDGPLSLIREPFVLSGTLAETPLPDTGELSAASVRIDV